MSTLLLALLSCSPEAPVRRFHVTASYGTYEVVGMAGTGLGTLHGYHVDGQFGLPTIVVNLGETIEITLQNDSFESMGLHPHGVHYDKDNEGVDRVAAPGESITYRWEATEGTGNFLYHSHEMDSAGYEYQAEAGIIGALVVLDPAEPPPDQMVTYLMMAAYEPWTESETGTPAPVEEEEAPGNSSTAARPTVPAPTGSTGTTGGASAPPSASFGESAPGHDETCGRDSEIVVPGNYVDWEIGRDDGLQAGSHGGGDTSDTASGHHGGPGGSTMGTHNHMMVVQTVSGAGWLHTDTRESNISKATLGGTLHVNVVSFGTEFHTFHLHGYTWKDPGTGLTTDSVTVGPGTGYGFSLPIDNPGLWSVHCHVESHTHSMSAWMDVE